VATAEGGAVVRSVVARYVVAAFAFIAAATWVGVSLTGGLKCLFVFVLALHAVRLYQRRHDQRSRRPASRCERPSREQAGRQQIREGAARFPAGLAAFTRCQSGQDDGHLVGLLLPYRRSG
jgi:hypothetical protein